MKVLIKGAGDLATGIAWRLHRCGYELLMTDIEIPTAVRRTVSFSRAIYEGNVTVEGVEAVFAGEYPKPGDTEENGDKAPVCHTGFDNSLEMLQKKINWIITEEKIPVIVDEKADIAGIFRPDVIVDAIIAKRNLGTKITDAPLVIGIGPGFTAGTDCDCVIETKRGHYLGKTMYSGSAIPNTGIPGNIGGFTTERIIRAAADGVFVPVGHIGDRVEQGDVVAKIIPEKDSGESCVYAEISGIIRGMLQDGVTVHNGMKCGDIDPRCEQEHCYTVSDKARAIGGGVLEAISRFERRRNSIGIVLLAAGAAKRYGSNKLLDTVNGRRMFEAAVDAAAGICADRTLAAVAGNVAEAAADISTDRRSNCITGPHMRHTVIVTGYDEIADYASGMGLTVVRNNRPELGISESIRLGIGALIGVSGILFTVCDQPGLSAASFARLIDSYAASDKGLACMGQGENLLGNPCVFSKKYFGELLELTGDTGGKRVIMAHRDDLKVVYASDEELADIDVPKP